MAPVEAPLGKRILSIDGGGFRGLGQLLFIDAITKAADTLGRDPATQPVPYKPSDIFDLTLGPSTGGLVAILLGTLGLDCTTAIAEYKALGLALFGNDRSKYLDVLTVPGATLSDGAYNTAIDTLVAKYTGSAATVWPDASKPQTAITTTGTTANPPVPIARSWDGLPTLRVTKVTDLIRQTTAAKNYLAPLKVKNVNFLDSADANPQLVNVTHLVENMNVYPPAEIGIIVNVGQLFSENKAAGYTAANRLPPDDVAQPFVNDLLSGYTATKPQEDQALVVVKEVLRQSVRIGDSINRMAGKTNYFRVDPPLGIGTWELVDVFEAAKVEQAVNNYIATPAGKKQIDDIANRLVKGKLHPPEEPFVHKDWNPACGLPRPTTEEDYLKTYQVIFVIDDSTSMILPPDYRTTGLRLDERCWNEARDALAGIADVAYNLQVNSVELRFLNSDVEYIGVKGAAALTQYMAQRKPPTNFSPVFYTPTGARLSKVLDQVLSRLDNAVDKPDVYKSIPPADIILLTDGEADDNPGQVLTTAYRRMRSNKHHPNYLNVQVIEVGSKPSSQAAKMTNPEIGQMVHVVPWSGALTYNRLKDIILGELQPSVRDLLAKK